MENLEVSQCYNTTTSKYSSDLQRNTKGTLNKYTHFCTHMTYSSKPTHITIKDAYIHTWHIICSWITQWSAIVPKVEPTPNINGSDTGSTPSWLAQQHKFVTPPRRGTYSLHGACGWAKALRQTSCFIITLTPMNCMTLRVIVRA